MSTQFLALPFHISLVATVFLVGAGGAGDRDMRILIRQPRLRIMSLPHLKAQRARVSVTEPESA